MATVTWGGLSGSWTTPTNWLGGNVPAGTDGAVINSGTATIGGSVPGITVNSITLGGSSATVAITDPGQTQTVNGAVSNAGILDIDATGAGGSSLSVGGTLSNTGTGADGVFIGNAAITQATAVTIGGLNNSGGITLAGGSATATATLTLDGTGLAGGTITMNAFAELDVGSSDTLTLQGATITGGTLSGTGGTITDNAFGATLNGVAISAGTTYTDSDGSDTTIEGTIVNDGTILVDSTGHGSLLFVNATGAALTGGGAVTLSTGIDNSIQGTGAGPKLTNVDNTISGAGEITGLSFDNQAAGIVDADDSGATLLFFEEQGTSVLTNEGTYEATNGGTLNLDATVLTQNQAATIEAIGTNGVSGAGELNSTVELSGATVNGGTLTTAGGGVIESFGGNGAILNGVTISGGSTYTDSNGSDTTIEGTIVNDGTILVDSTGAGSSLIVNATGATLTGGGAVTLSTGIDNAIVGTGTGPKLTNVDNTISGAGEITGLSFDNQAAGIVDADDSGATLLFFEEQGTSVLTNEGTYEATNGGTLNLDAAVLTQNQGGTIEASGTNGVIGTGELNSTVELSGATVNGGTLTTAGGGVIESFGGNGAILNGVTISSGSTYTDSNGSDTTLEGAIVNDGTILVDSTGAGSSLIVNATGATLTGGGAVTLSTGIDNAIVGTGTGPKLTNVDNTISGAGEITGLSFDNQAAGIVDADDSGATLLFFEEQGTSVLTNEGTYEATNGGTLNLDATVLTQNQGGAIEASGTNGASGAAKVNSTVELSGATVNGGTLTTAGGGVIESFGGNGAILNGVTISSGSTYTDSNGSDTTIEGTIVNNGTILVDSTGSGSNLIVNATGATLTGSGTVVLNPNAVNSEISGTGQSPQLVNASNTIEGAGQILGLSAFTNQSGGTVNADDQSDTLLISGITTLTNAGVFEATNGGILHVLPAIAGSGQLLVQAGSEIDLGGATSETTSFIGANGTLKLDTPSNYTGTIAGFAVGDTLDLGNTIAVSAAPTADGANTTLTVTLSGGSTLAYTLAGDYTADTFNVAKSGNDSLITVSAANAPPILGGADNTIGYLQGGPEVVVDGGLTVSDAADPIASTATVQIEAGFVSGDQLTFTPESGISGIYNPTSGILALSGIAGVGTYEIVLDSVSFSSNNLDPTNAGADQTRTVSWIVGNGAANSASVSSTIDVTALPVLGNAANTVSYEADGAAIAVDSGLTVSDFSSPSLTGATVMIGGGFTGGDQLNFTNQNGINGSYDPGTGVLTLSGTENLSDYEAALDSVTYSSTAADPSFGGGDFVRTISWVASSGSANSMPVMSTVDVGAPPELSGAGNATTYTQGEGPVVIDGALTASDVSSATLTGAMVTISGGALAGDVLAPGTANGINASFNGSVLTLSGQASVGAYTAALDGITYTSTAADPTAGGTDPNRTITWVVENGSQNSAPVTSTVGVTVLPPVIEAGGTVAYTPGGSAVAVDSTLIVSDVSSSTLNGATARITGGFLAGDQLTFAAQTGITGGYDPSTGLLTFTGAASLAAYQAELDSIAYSSTAADPTNAGTDPTRTIQWVASSGPEQSLPVTSTVSVTAPPVLGGASNAVTYTVGGAAVPVDGGLTVSDISSPTLDSVTVTITGGAIAGDVLTLGAASGITGSFSGGVLTLTGTATLAAYQAALDTITYSSTAVDPAAGGTDPTRTITWVATSGVETSAPVTSTIDLAIAPPVLSNAANTVGYTEGGPAAAIDENLGVSDVSSATLIGATVTIGGSFSGDQLGFTASGGISGIYAGGVLTLSGTALLSAYQTVLDSVAFSSTSNNPTDFGLDPTRTIVWQVTSGNSPSAAVSSTVDVTGVDQAPTLANAGNAVTFTLGGAAQPVDAGLAITDPDSLQMGGATVVIGNVLPGDTLSAANLDGGKITAAYSVATGTLTLSGTDSLSAYQNALDSVAFATTNTSTTPRNVSWQINDGSLNSNIVDSSVQIAILPPVLSGAGNSVTYNSGSAAVVVDSGLIATDQSSAVLTKATVSIGSGFQTGDVLNATNLDGGLITQSYTGGILTLSGTASVAAYQAALGSVTFRTTATGSAASSRQISFQANDQIPGGPNEASNIVSSTVSIPSSVQVISWINAKGGNFNTAANWSPAIVPGTTSEALLGSTATGTGASSGPPAQPTYTVTVSQSKSVGILDVSNRNATLTIAQNSTFSLGSQQPSSNAGTIAVAENGALNIGGTLSNTGILESTGPGAGPPPFATIENGTIANNGQITANGVSNLLLENVTVDNGPLGNLSATQTRAEFLSGQSPLVELDNTTIAGGQINAFGVSGFPLVAFETLAGSQSNVLDGTTSELSNSSFFQLNSNSALMLKGTIFNEGEFGLQPSANLQVSGLVTLSGGGSIGLNVVTPTSKVTATGANATLDNVNNTIDGAGTVGSANMTLINGGTIEALLGTLTVNTGSNSIANTGKLEAFVSKLVVDSPVTGTGSVEIMDGSAEFASSVSAGQTVTFDPVFPIDTLILDHAEGFAGTVAGMASTSRTAFDSIDLADFKFSSTRITSVTGTAQAGTTTNVTLTDSLDRLTATLHLLNQSANQFAVTPNAYSLTADGAGTLFSVDHTLGVPNTGVG